MLQLPVPPDEKCNEIKGDEARADQEGEVHFTEPVSCAACLSSKSPRWSTTAGGIKRREEDMASLDIRCLLGI